jgi:hypothetical protein
MDMKKIKITNVFMTQNKFIVMNIQTTIVNIQ